MKRRNYPIATQSISAHILVGLIFTALIALTWLTEAEDILENISIGENDVLGFRLLCTGICVSVIGGIVHDAMKRKYPK